MPVMPWIGSSLPERRDAIVARFTAAFPKDFVDAQRTIQQLREAKLYEIPTDLATSSYREVQRQVHENVLGVDFARHGPLADNTHMPGTLTEIGLPVVLTSTTGSRIHIARNIEDILRPRNGYLSADRVQAAIREGLVTPTIPQQGGGSFTRADMQTALAKAADDVEFPALPFPSVFLGTSRELLLAESEIKGRMMMRAGPDLLGAQAGNWRPWSSLGFLFVSSFLEGSEGGYKILAQRPAALELLRGEDDVIEIVPHCYGDTGWLGDFVYPWWFRMLFRAINHQDRLYVRQEKGALTFGQRRAREKLKADYKIPSSALSPPSPYYVVSLDPVAVSRMAAQAAPAGPYPWTHRWDVSAHERLLVRRGPGPLDPRGAHGLRRRGYDVFESGVPIPPDLLAELDRKDHPPRGDEEWLAVRRVRVREHVRGPEDRPYVPALRAVSEAP